MEQFLFGALKPKVDVRDYKVAAAAAEYPESYLCENLPPIKNQKSVSSCVAHATATILEAFNKTETGRFTPLSTNFIYGMQGVAFGRLESGMYLRDACKIVKEYGNATESSVGGNTEQPKCTEWLKEKLTDKIYEEAKNYRIESYAKCKTANDIKYALMNYGPVLSSVKWYKKYTSKDGVLTFNKTSEHGYHAIMICGWNKKGWVCQNSWGKKWNGDGTFIYPFEEAFRETWAFVDASNTDIITPKSNRFFNRIYKIINFIVNLFKSKK
jgi:C1A family cysteine protease